MEPTQFAYRRGLIVAFVAASAASYGDVLMLYVGNSQRPEWALPPTPIAMLWIGALLLLVVCATPTEPLRSFVAAPNLAHVLFFSDAGADCRCRVDSRRVERPRQP